MSETLTEAVKAIDSDGLSAVLEAVARSGEAIAHLCRTGNVAKTASTNTFGDDQLQIDIAADETLMRNLADTGLVHTASSEETPLEKTLSEDGHFVVVFDPLDGSSIISSNFAVGTIVGIWKAQGLIGVRGCDMIASVAIVYGPRTTMYIAHRQWAVKEFTLRDGSWVMTDAISRIEEGKLFAPANLRCAQDNAGYGRLVEYYLKERYTLRYTGGMVPDVVQILVKRKGVFVSPVSEKAGAKLRVVYECIPMAFLVECAGGRSSDGHGSVLNRVVKQCDERCGICVGSAAEVERFEEYCGRSE